MSAVIFKLCCVFLLIVPKLHFYSILNLLLRFTKEEAEVRKQAFLFVPALYIRTCEVISVVHCVFLQRKQGFKRMALNPNFDVISEVNCVLPRKRYILDFRFQLKAKTIPDNSGRLELYCIFLEISK